MLMVENLQPSSTHIPLRESSWFISAVMMPLLACFCVHGILLPSCKQQPRQDKRTDKDVVFEIKFYCKQYADSGKSATFFNPHSPQGIELVHQCSNDASSGLFLYSQHIAS